MPPGNYIYDNPKATKLSMFYVSTSSSVSYPPSGDEIIALFNNKTSDDSNTGVYPGLT